MSNHSHLSMTDVNGVFPKFMCEMNSLISRQLNALSSGEGTNIEKGYTCTEMADEESILRTSAYILANPCLADLVERALDWNSVCTYKYEYGVPFVVKRPKCGMWTEAPSKASTCERPPTSQVREGRSHCSDGRQHGAREGGRRRQRSKLPEEVEGVLSRPDICPDLTNEELRAQIRARATYKEKQAATKRRKRGKKVLGWIKAIDLPSHMKPRTRQEIFRRKPLVTADRSELLLACLEKIYRFRQAYREAWKRYVHDGREQAIFPRGTWKMKTVMNARCRP